MGVVSAVFYGVLGNIAYDYLKKKYPHWSIKIKDLFSKARKVKFNNKKHPLRSLIFWVAILGMVSLPAFFLFTPIPLGRKLILSDINIFGYIFMSTFLLSGVVAGLYVFGFFDD